MILAAEVQRAKDELMAERKSSGDPDEERMEAPPQVETLKPKRGCNPTGDLNQASGAPHPWAGGDTVAPR